MKVRKYSSLSPPKSIFYKTHWSWQGVKITRLMSIFISQKVWKFLIKIQQTKSNPKIMRGVNPPCLMAIRVKKLWQHYSPRWIFCPSPKDEIRIRLQLHCPLSRFCTAIVDVFSSPFNDAQRYILTLYCPITAHYLNSFNRRQLTHWLRLK